MLSQLSTLARHSRSAFVLKRLRRMLSQLRTQAGHGDDDNDYDDYNDDDDNDDGNDDIDYDDNYNG
ncbi:hypothetical protein DPMN_134222 [Dreissena polymorpha]|uniref:Uncharacterized protein n=1 Tax=Dreissena polymorpha TaxID=45954 RepID=A0A9D4JFL4_DREPO|nr:hypothetical protein DPMN_134222 [Dreissena polymorpha]